METRVKREQLNRPRDRNKFQNILKWDFRPFYCEQLAVCVDAGDGPDLCAADAQGRGVCGSMLGFPSGFLPEKGHLYRLAFLKLSQHFRQRLQFVFGQDGAGDQKCFSRLLIDDLFVAG